MRLQPEYGGIRTLENGRPSQHRPRRADESGSTCPGPPRRPHRSLQRRLTTELLEDAGDNARRRNTSRLTAAIAVSTSSSELKRPRLNRSELCASWVSRPNARSTYEGSADAELHAEPVDMASSASPTTRLSPSTPSKETLRMPGKRVAPSPLRWTPPKPAMPAQRRSRSAAKRDGFRRLKLLSQRTRGAQPDDLMGRQCPWPQPALLAAAEGDRLKTRPSPSMHIQSARPLGPVELMAGEREDIDRQLC